MIFARNPQEPTGLAQELPRDFQSQLIQRIETVRVYYPLRLIMSLPEHYVSNEVTH